MGQAPRRIPRQGFNEGGAVMKRKKKTFDCIDFKRRFQTRIYEDIRGMTFEEEVTYFQRRAEQGNLGEWWRWVKAESAAVPSPTDQDVENRSGEGAT